MLLNPPVKIFHYKTVSTQLQVESLEWYSDNKIYENYLTK